MKADKIAKAENKNKMKNSLSEHESEWLPFKRIDGRDGIVYPVFSPGLRP